MIKEERKIKHKEEHNLLNVDIKLQLKSVYCTGLPGLIKIQE
jgi:hypothetical protein